ncbi:QRFP-like peptide receptor [Lingula anatina]|uniref:QRFP-like peptide receptor n=1 Tax=Lingula anatina TaxID=7574 RepID=A0A1S3KDE4_LINAN|nr:QRFP-like peptide receptor [Lingula anatina]XP_013420644.1 QRFP-like peptide receptor [Lingula anatina]XP_013420645.1 QRFP-like peptide receptor [Lingula anatina]XP_013420647.1 QRFP-like peptide receptor [Lingula anatina]XP_013420648.1 QRFP-like peptide receptor [Lingula anatina]XP_013420649.1 QRFP-like peptide receptor [Lingula anatina]XP_013420650.1 QRFP-like peptide receptor [Lingula anatina]XP_013420651.1 QRFP-like peptide receptor [Lingula anatina]XP_013420652.1 QRFP-like peptide re|eukprot:XP_013420643.1 QRFP-like peptide receptor [Lingula anatina]
MALSSFFNETLGFFKPIEVSINAKSDKTTTPRIKTTTTLQESGRTPDLGSPVRTVTESLLDSLARPTTLSRGENYIMTTPTSKTLSSFELSNNFTVGLGSWNLTDTFLENKTANVSENMWQPNPLPMNAQTLLILFYCLAAFLAIFGNIIVIVTFVTGKRSRGDLRIYLINLAVADLLMAIFCIPFSFTVPMLSYWIFSEPLCPIVQFMQVSTVTVSVSTNMAIGFDRFWAVYYPLKSRLFSGARVKIVIAIIWGISISLAMPMLVVGRYSFMHEYKGRTYIDCAETWALTSKRIYGLIVLVFTYIIPLTIMIVTYSLVGRRLWRRTAPGNANVARDTAQLQSKRKVIKMLLTIVALFGICWLPLHLFIQILDFAPYLYSVESAPILDISFYCVHWLAMSNSFQNPIIYGFLNDSFQADFQDLVLRVMPCCQWSPCCKKKYKLGYMMQASMKFTDKFSRQMSKESRKNSCQSLSQDSTKESMLRAQKASLSSSSSSRRSQSSSYKQNGYNARRDKESEPDVIVKLLPSNGRVSEQAV